MHTRRLAPAIVLGAVLPACAGAPTPEPVDEAPDAPFIKLANRRMGLALHFGEGGGPPGYQQAFGRALARRLESTYRTKVAFAPRRAVDPAADGLSDAEILWAVKRRIDDVVRVRVDAPKPGALAPTVEVIAVGNLDVRHHLPLPPVRAKGAADRPTAERLADLTSLQISKTWTDPGAAPRVQPLAVANRLAALERCRPAVTIYDAVMPKTGAGNFGDIRALSEAQRLHAACGQRVRTADLMRADARATFSVRLSTREFVPEVEAAFEAAFRRADLSKTLAKFTDKPIEIVARPAGLVLRMRYHPERLRDRLSADAELPTIDLSPLVPVMDALVDLRGRAADRVPRSARAVREIKTTLRLQRLPHSYLEIDYADLDGRILLTDSLRVKLGRNAPVVVKAHLPTERNTQRFVLGPWQTDTGQPSAAAAVGRFLDLR